MLFRSSQVFDSGQSERYLLESLGQELFSALSEMDPLGKPVSARELKALGTIQDGVLTTTADLLPEALVGYDPDSGKRNLRRGDLVLIQADGVDPRGYQGIHEVATVTNNTLKIARFVTQTPLGGRIYYRLTNATSFKGTASEGVVARQTFTGARYTYLFDATSKGLDLSVLEALFDSSEVGFDVTLKFVVGSSSIGETIVLRKISASPTVLTATGSLGTETILNPPYLGSGSGAQLEFQTLNPIFDFSALDTHKIGRAHV